MMEVFERQDPPCLICENPRNLWIKRCLSAGFLEQRMRRYMAGYIRESLRGRLSPNSEVGRPRQRLVRPHQRFRSRPRRTRRGCRRLVASGSGRVEAPASGDIRRTGRAAAVDSGPGVQGGIMTSAIQAARFWHPSGMRGDSSGVPGVSLRSTPGYGLRSLRDEMPKPAEISEHGRPPSLGSLSLGSVRAVTHSTLRPALTTPSRRMNHAPTNRGGSAHLF